MIPVMQTDAELVQAVLAGRTEDFGLLVERYERAVTAVAMHVLGGRDAAQEAVQEAFVRAFERLAHLRKPESFGPWLLRIARRCALDQTRRRTVSLDAEGLAATPVAGNGHLNVDHCDLLQAVLRLPEPQRQVVMLRYFEGYTVQQVAQAAGRSVGTVTKQLSRAHKRLRTMLRDS